MILSAFVLIGNPLIVMAIMGWMGYRKRTGFLAGLTVAQIGEFSIVFVVMGISLGLTTLVGVVTIALSTYMILYSQSLYVRLAPWLGVFERRRHRRRADPAARAESGGLDELRRLLGAASAEVEQRLQDDARERLARLATELGPQHGVSAPLSLTSGRVSSAILDQADALDAGLIVVVACGEGCLGRLLIGTTSERLLRRSLRPMLVVKQTPHEAYRRVLVPVHFSAASAPALRLARAVAPGAEFVLLHAFEAPFESKLRYAGMEEATLNRYLIAARQDALARLQDLAVAVGLASGQVHLHVEHGGASRAILAQEQELDCDLIVLGKHGQGLLKELLWAA